MWEETRHTAKTPDFLDVVGVIHVLDDAVSPLVWSKEEVGRDEETRQDKMSLVWQWCPKRCE